MNGLLTSDELTTCKSTVAEALALVSEFDEKLQREVGDYLVTGDDATVLLRVAAAFQKPGREPFFSGKPSRKGDLRRLAAIFAMEKVPAGYYRRLGEFAGAIPEVNKKNLEGDPTWPEWFFRLTVFRRLLATDSDYVYYALDIVDNMVKVAPWLDDCEDSGARDAIIASVVSREDKAHNHAARFLTIAGDWHVVFQKYADSFRNAMRAASANAREATLQWLDHRKFQFEPVVPLIAELATSGSKKVKLTSVEILRRFTEQAEKLLVDFLQSPEAVTRAGAAEAMVAVLGGGAEPHLKKALKTEKAQRVAQAMESLLGHATSMRSEISAPASIQLPPLDLPLGEVPLPAEFGKRLREQLDAAFDKLDAQYVKQVEQFNSPTKPSWMSKPAKPVRLGDDEVATVLAFMEGKANKPPSKSQWIHQAAHNLPIWTKWTDLGKLQLIHVVRFLKAFQQLDTHYYGLNVRLEDWLESHRAAQAKPYGLRELDAAVSTLEGIEPGAVPSSYLQNNAWRSFLDWEPEAVWPVFAERLDLFRDAILGITKKANDYWAANRRRMAMKVAAMFPRLPKEVELTLWSIALGESKTDRPAARAALHACDDRLTPALKAIEDGRQGVRIAAAEMLAEIGDKAAVEPLKKALKNEKIELVKGAMLLAIEQLGGDVDEFLGRRKQLLDAQKGLAKKRPKGMEWFPLDSAPKVRWADDNKPVAKEIVDWWVVQSVQFKMPTCGALLRRSLAMCRKDDAATLAKHILSAWIAHDTKTPTRDEVIAKATQQAAQQWNAGQQWMVNYYKTQEGLRDVLASQMENTFLQSAIDQKGLLAIVSAAGDVGCVKMIEKYIRTYHGHRLAQSKALLETLGWIEDTMAVQLLLTFANRFRTKAIRQRAAEMVDELASRQGWTMNQLADRTIPDAGFASEEDAEGNPVGRPELVLDYGARQFKVYLGDDLQPVISKADGTVVKSLPDAAKEDDPEKAKAAKKEFSDAKKLIKEVVKSQAERLYEATCVQRVWPAAEWRRYLARHPIAGALCRRVVWAARGSDSSEAPRLFRPLEDGSLTDVNDDEFTLGENDMISVAHSSMLDEATEAAWKKHLRDYEVPELFKQFGRPTYRLPKALENDTAIQDFRGHMLTTYRLRSRGNKLGWARGDAEDGGSFGIYYKPFRSEKIQAVVGFSGSYVPESDIPAALHELYFVPLKPNDDSASSWNPNRLKLGKVSAVLLSECYNDMREMAAEGTGFDPEWEKKGLW